MPEAVAGLAHMAADILGVPLATVAVVDGERLRFLGEVGFGLAEMPLSASLLMPRLEREGHVCLLDMQADRHFKNHPLVTGGPRLRFVAAAPLSAADGTVFGFVAGFDTAPHEEAPTPVQQRLLRALATQALALLAAHGRERTAVGNGEKWFRLTTRAARLGVADYHPQSGQFGWSDELRAMIGAPEDAVPSPRLALSVLEPEGRQLARNWLGRCGVPPFFHNGPHGICIRRLDTGELRWLEVRVWTSPADGDATGRVVFTIRDVTDERQSEERMRWAAEHDPLTGLANRRLFARRLDEAVRRAERDQTQVGLLLFDLDKLKQVNDTLGHDAGDFLLHTFVDRLEQVRRQGDTLARLGGDEFALIMPGLCDRQQLLDLAQSVLARMREPLQFGNKTLECRASIGASVYPEHGRDANSLQRNADVALYRAKAQGRCRLVVFEAEMRSELQLHSSMLEMARQALNSDGIVPYFQPKIALATGKLVGFEALLRWRHPRRGIQGPGHIAAAFEDTDLAEALSVRMFSRVVAQMRAWLDAGYEFGHVAVNASAAEFLRDGFAERVLSQLRDADVPPRYLELEVTESVLLGHQADHADHLLRTLSEAGIRIALDDFGTGFASLAHLKRFPVDTIKIDQSFVRDLEHNAYGGAIIRAVISLGQSLGMTVVAEGIETEAQVRFLQSHQCDVGQGFFFGRPAEASSVEALLAPPGKGCAFPFP